MSGWVLAVTILLAAVTLFVGLMAALLWWMASEPIPVNPKMPDTPPFQIRRLQLAIIGGGALNQQAAQWTAGAVVLNALTTVWAVIAPLIWH